MVIGNDQVPETWELHRKGAPQIHRGVGGEPRAPSHRAVKTARFLSPSGARKGSGRRRFHLGLGRRKGRGEAADPQGPGREETGSSPADSGTPHAKGPRKVREGPVLSLGEAAGRAAHVSSNKDGSLK